MGKHRLLRTVRRPLDKLADHPRLLDAAARLIVQQITRRQAGTDWRMEGQDALAAALAEGPVIVATWHGRLAMSPWLWRPDWGPVASLTSSARPGRIVARVHNAFGIDSVPMHDRKDNRAASMHAARLVRNGRSLAFACDGPLGPARRMPRGPLDWARLTGAPIWLWAYSVEAFTRLPTWDRMVVPKGRGKGIMLYRKATSPVPKRASDAEIDALRAHLEAELNALTQEADRAMGHRDIIA